jgi:membrane protease YdiL (CAAX protease family)
MGLGGRGWLNPFALAIFCQALVGLALARSLPGYEPLPVTQAMAHRKSILRQLVYLVGFALLFALIAFLIGSVGMGIIQQLVGESQRSAAAPPPIQLGALFFLLLAGAGIAEETTYRLVCLSFFWRWTHRPRLAIFLSAILFGAYHLTPLSGMYLTFWQFPVSQFAASMLIGLVWGYAYIKRGYEVAVLAHTLSDWVPFLLFSAA